MKIQLGIGSKQDAARFISEDADELYIGLKNLPGHLYGSKHTANIDEVLEILDMVHMKGKKLFVVANEVRGDLFNDTLKTLDELVRKKIDGIIIRDISLLEALKNKRINTYLILSSLALCFNRDCLNFYKKLGINRIALPEHITYQEAKPLINNRIGIDTEMFITAREFCLVLNSFCYLHSDDGGCNLRKPFLTETNKNFIFPGFTLKEHFKNLYNFYKYGCDIIKLGRAPEDFSQYMLQEAILIKKLLELNYLEDEFIDHALSIHSKFTRLIGKWQKKQKKLLY